jgi:hypothetical protein
VAVNVTARDIVNFPGGTAKTITVDIIQSVPKGSAEGDETWLMSTVTTATASGGGSIQNIFKNEMIRGFVKSSGLIDSPFTIAASTRIKVSIDEDISNGVDVTLTEGTNLSGEDVAQDLENKIQTQAVFGLGGAKIKNLSYLNAQVRFVDNKFQIESGTVSDSFGGTTRSSVDVAAPSSGVNAIPLLGFDIPTKSEVLAARQITETSLSSAYTGGDILDVSSTAGFDTGDAIQVNDGTNSQIVVTSGVLTGQIQFATQSGITGLEKSYAAGSMVRKLHAVDVANPVSAITTVDQLYRFGIDSAVNQIDFSI